MNSIQLVHHEHYSVLTINRPQALNALNAEVFTEIDSVVSAKLPDSSRLLLLTGSGEKAFAAGADITEFTALSGEEARNLSQHGQRIFDKLENYYLPTIALIHGYALGGGCELSMACDYRIAGEKAVFGQPEVLLGIIPGGGGTQRLPRLVGSSRAKEIVMTGRQVKSDEALRIGLVDEVVPNDQLHERAFALAAEVARGALQAHAAMKRAIDEGMSSTLADGLLLERQLFTDVFATDDSQIGVKSFLEHGPGKATFTGK